MSATLMLAALYQWSGLPPGGTQGICGAHIIHGPFAAGTPCGLRLGIVYWLLAALCFQPVLHYPTILPTSRTHETQQAKIVTSREHINIYQSSIHLHEGAWAQLVFVVVEQGRWAHKCVSEGFLGL